MEAEEKKKMEQEFNKNWEESRQGRVNSWMDFKVKVGYKNRQRERFLCLCSWIQNVDDTSSCLILKLFNYGTRTFHDPLTNFANSKKLCLSNLILQIPMRKN